MSIYIYIIYTPNLGLEVAVFNRVREQGRFRGSRAALEGAAREQGGALREQQGSMSELSIYPSVIRPTSRSTAKPIIVEA